MRVGEVMRRLVPPASYVLLLLFLTGGWLIMSPFAMQTQPSGQHWSAPTINNVTLGGILMVVSLLGILGYMGFALRDLLREAQAKQLAEQAASQETAPANA
jgi:TRAP-type C4-dicarboxylate transport system permease small subunit